MGGITSSGLFSGIDSASLIEQLLAVEARPRTLAQRRIASLQTQQAAYLDLNTRLSSLRTAAAAFRVDNVFDIKTVASSDESVMSATASTGAQPGEYSFIVDRLVSTRQLLSRGFADRDRSAFGGTEFRFEGLQARLDRDTELAELNGGSGVQRGKIVVRDASGASSEIDLSRAATVNEVLDAINGSGGISVTASLVDGGFVLTDTSGGGGTLSVSEVNGGSTAASLGLNTAAAGNTLTGARVWRLSESTNIATLNDGAGLRLRATVGTSASAPDFTIDVGGTSVNVKLGEVFGSPGDLDNDGNPDPAEVLEPKVATIGDVLARINGRLDDAGLTDVRARLNADGTGLEIADLSGSRTIEVTAQGGSSAAADLGILNTGSPASGTLSGGRLLSGLNSVGLGTLNGGAGIGDGQLTIETRDGNIAAFTLDTTLSVTDLLAEVSAQTGGRVTAALNQTGTGLVFTDTTSGAGDFTISGSGAVGTDTAELLGIDQSTTGSTIGSRDLERQYVFGTTLLEDLNGGRGIGTGEIRITNSLGAITTVTIGDNQETVSDLLALINGAAGGSVTAQINASGDGIEIVDAAGGTQALKIEDVTGSVASRLKIEGEASDPATDNRIVGTEETVVTFDPTDTLQDAVRKINEAGGPVRASILNDGSAANPFRISLTATASGREGRFVFDTGGFDLGLSVLDEGDDARVFFGSSDPAKGVLLTSSSNTLDDAVQGVTIDLKQTSDTPVRLTVSESTSAAEDAVDAFIEAFNTAVDRIDFQTRFVTETEVRGPLIGDSTALLLRSRLFQAVQGPAQDLDGRFQRLSDIGIRVGEGGNLTFDRDRFRAALDEDPESVQALLTQREVVSVAGTTEFDQDGITVTGPASGRETFGAMGVTALIEELTKSYTDSVDGLLTLRGNALDDQISSQETRIEAIDLRLEQRRTFLERQFLAMEQAIASLQSQQRSLGQIVPLG